MHFTWLLEPMEDACVAPHVLTSPALVGVVAHAKATIGALLVQAIQAELLLPPIAMLAFPCLQPLADLLPLRFTYTSSMHLRKDLNLALFFLDQIGFNPQSTLAQALTIFFPFGATSIAKVMWATTCHMVAPRRQLHHNAAPTTTAPPFPLYKLLKLLLFCRLSPPLPCLFASGVRMSFMLASQTQQSSALRASIVQFVSANDVQIQEVGTEGIYVVHLLLSLCFFKTLCKQNLLGARSFEGRAYPKFWTKVLSIFSSFSMPQWSSHLCKRCVYIYTFTCIWLYILSIFYHALFLPFDWGFLYHYRGFNEDIWSSSWGDKTRFTTLMSMGCLQHLGGHNVGSVVALTKSFAKQPWSWKH